MRLRILVLVVLCAMIATPSFGQLLNPFLAGFQAVVPEHGIEHNGVQNGGNWEAYCEAFGDGTLAAASIREEIGDTPGTERAFVAMYDPTNNMAIVDGFYTTTNFPNDPWATNNDLARATGNPARIGTDRTPGGTKYMLANEATPWAFPALFPNFSTGVTYTIQMSTIQFFNKTSGGTTITPLTNAEDPMYSPGDTWTQNGQNRFGGDCRGLSNGGFVVQVEAQTTNGSPTGDRWLPVTIYDSNGTRVTGPFNGNQVAPTARTTGWSNVAAYNGGFANRPESGGEIDGVTRTVQFWLNNGTPDGVWEFTGANTSITDNSGGSNRIMSHPASQYVYFGGKGSGLGGNNTGVFITKIDTVSKTTVDEAFVNDTFSSAVERIFISVNANDEVFVCWSEGATNQMLGRLYDENLDPVTDAFYCFENSNVANFTSRRPSCALADDGRILITGRFEGAGATGVPAYAGTFDDDQVGIVIQIATPDSGIDNWDLND